MIVETKNIIEAKIILMTKLVLIIHTPINSVSRLKIPKKIDNEVFPERIHQIIIPPFA